MSSTPEIDLCRRIIDFLLAPLREHLHDDAA